MPLLSSTYILCSLATALRNTFDSSIGVRGPGWDELMIEMTGWMGWRMGIRAGPFKVYQVGERDGGVRLSALYIRVLDVEIMYI